MLKILQGFIQNNKFLIEYVILHSAFNPFIQRDLHILYNIGHNSLSNVELLKTLQLPTHYSTAAHIVIHVIHIVIHISMGNLK